MWFLQVFQLWHFGTSSSSVLYIFSKWPLWQFNMKIHLILVYWDARISISYNLVTPFKDGVTFADATATQSLQRCYLENVAEMSYVAINVCHFWSKLSKFWIENAHTRCPDGIGGHRGFKTRSKAWFHGNQNHQKSKKIATMQFGMCGRYDLCSSN